jgi:hypothetical protein
MAGAIDWPLPFSANDEPSASALGAGETQGSVARSYNVLSEHDFEVGGMSATVTPADSSDYLAFVESQIRQLGKTPPTVLWHYTNGNALIKIIETGSLFSTQKRWRSN